MRLKKTLVLVGLFASCSVSAFAAPVKYSPVFRELTL